MLSVISWQRHYSNMQFPAASYPIVESEQSELTQRETRAIAIRAMSVFCKTMVRMERSLKFVRVHETGQAATIYSIRQSVRNFIPASCSNSLRRPELFSLSS